MPSFKEIFDPNPLDFYWVPAQYGDNQDPIDVKPLQSNFHTLSPLYQLIPF